MKKLIIFFTIIPLIGCTKIEPIQIIEPLRDINTESLEKYKSNLENRNVVIGMIYGWGKLNQSNLMNTPDSLDIVVLKDGYLDISEYQAKDLKDTQTKKATKILLGIDFSRKIAVYEENLEKEIREKKANKKEELKASGEVLTEDESKKIFDNLELKVRNRKSNEVEQDMKNLSSEFLTLIKQNNFDGISIEFPTYYNDDYTMEKIQKFLEDVSREIGKNKSKILILENPFSVKEKYIKQANWVVFKQKEPTQLLSAIESASNEFGTTHFVPASDFTIEELDKGFKDSERFPIPNQIYEIIYWKSENKAGVAYYHIEENYNDIVGNTTYKTLRTAINKAQLN